MDDKRYYIIDLQSIVEHDGQMVVLESGKQIQFEMKRMFCISKVGVSKERGAHANQVSKLILISLAGSCIVDIDDGTNKDIINLEQPNKGLVIDVMVWKRIYNFSKDCILIALADHLYDKNETIDDFNEFLRKVHVR